MCIRDSHPSVSSTGASLHACKHCEQRDLTPFFGPLPMIVREPAFVRMPAGCSLRVRTSTKPSSLVPVDVHQVSCAGEPGSMNSVLTTRLTSQPDDDLLGAVALLGQALSPPLSAGEFATELPPNSPETRQSPVLRSGSRHATSTGRSMSSSTGQWAGPSRRLLSSTGRGLNARPAVLLVLVPRYRIEEATTAVEQLSGACIGGRDGSNMEADVMVKVVGLGRCHPQQVGARRFGSVLRTTTRGRAWEAQGDR